MITKRFNQALDYATNIHANQKRKGYETPFISHLLSVCALVLEDGGTEDEAIAALLHDSVEDQGGLDTLAEINKLFGDDVAQIVMECSDSYLTPKPPWKERKEQFMGKINSISDSAVRVIIADKLHNVRSVLQNHQVFGSELWSNFKGGREGTIWYYHEMHKLLNNRIQSINLAILSKYINEMNMKE